MSTWITICKEHTEETFLVIVYRNFFAFGMRFVVGIIEGYTFVCELLIVLLVGINRFVDIVVM